MTTRTPWTRQQLLIAFELYCRLPYGKLDHRTPQVIRYAEAIDRTPSALAMKLSNIASLDPAITSTGRVGLRGASAADHAMWEEMSSDWERFAIESRKSLLDLGITDKLDDTTADYEDNEIDIHRIGQDRPVQTTARVGQNFFRAAVLSAYNEQCCITGLSMPALLVASHIVPWSHDSANRVNPRNGLLLSALHDKAFDNGLLTISDNMTVRVSRAYAGNDDRFFATAIAAYDGRRIRLPEKFTPDRDFLAYHREHVFQN